ncbi:MAG: TonB-dependent receptor [Hyphomonadaceae bacterium]|nr:TonB-dependent receptor [Hyphomonadaceae bacterium]
MKKQLIITAAALCMAPAIASAQDADQRESWANETIVVTGQRPSLAAPNATTATRTPTPIEEIPQSIQTITRTLIDEQDLQTPGDALANVSGVTSYDSTEVVIQSPLIRGFAAQYFTDGVLSYALPSGISDPGSLAGVERIEVAKGPASTLYGGGRGAPLGGVINFVSRTPGSDPRLSAGVRAGSFNTRGADLDLNAPLGGEAGFRLSGSYEQADSYINVVEGERYAIYPSLVLAVSPDTRLTVRGQLSRIEQLEYSGLPVELTAPSLVVDRFAFAGAEDAPLTASENRLLTAQLDHDLNESWQVALVARHTESRTREYSTFPFGALGGTTYGFFRGLLPADVEQVYLGANLIGRFEFGGAVHQILFGAERDQTDYEARLGFGALGFIDYADRSTNLAYVEPAATDIQRDALRTTAFYIQDQAGIGERLDVTIGLRWSSLEVDSYYESGSFPFVDTDRTYDRVTPRLGVTYEIFDGLSAFAGYSEGFQGLVAALGVTDPEPEEAQSYEAGLKFASPIEGLTGTVALYQLTRQNVRTPDPGNPGFSIQSGEQRARGFEVDLLYEPSAALSVLFNYAYTDAEVTRDNALPVGDRLARVPEHAGRLAARYRFQNVLRRFEIGGGVTYASERELTLPNTASVDGLALVDAQAAYVFGPASLSLSIVNLFDDDGFEPYPYLGGAFVIPTQPRSAFLTLRSNF